MLRLVLELDGETVTELGAVSATCIPVSKKHGVPHVGQGVTFVTRMDYLTPFFNEAAYVLGVEKLLGISQDIPSAPTSSEF